MKKIFLTPPRMVGIKETARITGLSCYYLRQLTKNSNSRVKFIKSGNKTLINLDSLIEFLNTGENMGTTQYDSIKERKAHNEGNGHKSTSF